MLFVEFAGGGLEQFGELVRRIAADAFDPDGTPPLLVAWRPEERAALVVEIPAEYFTSPEAKDGLGQVIATSGTDGVAMVAVISESWIARRGSPALEELQRSDRSLAEIRDAGIDGVGECVTAWLGDAARQGTWIAEIERDASGARLGRWELWPDTPSRWHGWFQAGIAFAEREGADH
jgi:hypothetical protein